MSIKSTAQIQISPYVPEDLEGMSYNTHSALQNCLRSLLSSQGLLSNFGQSRFVLTSNYDVLDKNVISSAPTKYVYRLSITLAVGDGIDGTCFGSTSVISKGIGDTEEKAIFNAIKTLNKDEKIERMLHQAGNRVVEYYNNYGPGIISNARALSKANQYKEALYSLSLIPQESTSYSAAASLKSKLYVSYVNYSAAQQLSEARALWASNPTKENAIEVIEKLSDISTGSACYPQVKSFINAIQKRVNLENDREWKAEQDAFKRADNLEKYRINAAQSIAIAYAKSRPKVVYHIHGWY